MLKQTARHQATTGTGDTVFPSNPFWNSRFANVRNCHSISFIGTTQSIPAQTGNPRVGAKRWKPQMSVAAESATIA
jgi:hypothetical protein